MWYPIPSGTHVGLSLVIESEDAAQLSLVPPAVRLLPTEKRIAEFTDVPNRSSAQCRADVASAPSRTRREPQRVHFADQGTVANHVRDLRPEEDAGVVVLLDHQMPPPYHSLRSTYTLSVITSCMPNVQRYLGPRRVIILRELVLYPLLAVRTSVPLGQDGAHKITRSANNSEAGT